mmetsp:Transcript_36919/g.50891  ORF Transcript_36919/g.50891 Transcript_36919/m.50891 type:complete len:161 (+) Transcript_36919:242-724(+)
MDQIPRRSSLPLAEGTKQVAKKQTGRKGGTLATVRTKQGQVKTEKAAQSAKWDEEEWMLVPPVQLRDCFVFPLSGQRMWCWQFLIEAKSPFNIIGCILRFGSIFMEDQEGKNLVLGTIGHSLWKSSKGGQCVIQILFESSVLVLWISMHGKFCRKMHHAF